MVHGALFGDAAPIADWAKLLTSPPDVKHSVCFRSLPAEIASAHAAWDRNWFESVVKHREVKLAAILHAVTGPLGVFQLFFLQALHIHNRIWFAACVAWGINFRGGDQVADQVAEVHLTVHIVPLHRCRGNVSLDTSTVSIAEVVSMPFAQSMCHPMNSARGHYA